jgi:hypothetical protein
MPGERSNLAGRAVLAAACLLALLGGIYLGIALRWFGAPYPSFGKEIAWLLGEQEAAYNFGVVEPGRVYRSGKPDERLIRYLRERYGVTRIVSLAGPFPAHETARELGIEVRVFDWPIEHLPPLSELQAVLGMLDSGGPTLVHCWGGSDRTGVTMAAYRVRRDGWSLGEAVREMARYGHLARLHAGLHRELRSLLGPRGRGLERGGGGGLAAGAAVPPVRRGAGEGGL